MSLKNMMTNFVLIFRTKFQLHNVTYIRGSLDISLNHFDKLFFEFFSNVLNQCIKTTLEHC